jgi:RNA polymerase sigma factor (sigma-70 family)
VNEPLHTALRQLRRLAASDAGGVSDAQLLHRFVSAREEAAFELLVWRHERMVLGVCRRVLGDVHEAEDAFQATFLALARRATTINGGEAVGAWLYRVALRGARRARGRNARPVHAPPSAEHGPASPGLDPSEAAAWRELRPLLDDEVGRLPEKYRTPIVLCYLEGKTYDEAARDLGCPRGTVSIRLTRARELLRKRLVRRGLVLSAAVFTTLLTSAGADASGALVKSTVQLSLLFASGAAATVPGPVLALTEGVLRAMSTSHQKVIVGGLVLAAVTALGVGGVLAQKPGKIEVPAPPIPGAGDAGRADPDAASPWRESATFASTANQVSAVTFSPDGTRIAFVDDGGTVTMLDVASGKLLFTTETGTNPLVCAAFSPDGKRLAIGGGSAGKAAIFFLLDPVGRVMKLESGHDGTITAVAFSPDGKMLLTAGVDGTARLTDAATGKMLRTLAVQKDAVFSAVFSPDGRLLVTAGGPHEIAAAGNVAGATKVWDAATGKQIRSLAGHEMTVSSAAFSPDGRTVATSSFDKTVRVWDVATGKELTEAKGHDFYVRQVAFSPDGKFLASAGFDETVRVWDAATGKEMTVLRGHKGLVTGVAFSPDGRLLATCSGKMRFKLKEDGKAEVRVWSLVPPGPKRGDDRGGKAPAADGRLDALVAELLKSQRGDEACVEALTLATLGRFPTDAERKFAAAELGRSQDRRKTLGDLLFMLTSTKECRAHADELRNRAAVGK